METSDGTSPELDCRIERAVDGKLLGVWLSYSFSAPKEGSCTAYDFFFGGSEPGSAFARRFDMQVEVVFQGRDDAFVWLCPVDSNTASGAGIDDDRDRRRCT